MLLQTIFQQFLEVHLIQPFSRSYNENDKLKKIQTLFLKVGKNGKNSRLWHFLIQRRGKDKLLTLSRMSNKKLTNNHIFSCPGQLYRWPCQSVTEKVMSLLNSVSSEHCRAVVDTSFLTRQRQRPIVWTGSIRNFAGQHSLLLFTQPTEA